MLSSRCQHVGDLHVIRSYQQCSTLFVDYPRLVVQNLWTARRIQFHEQHCQAHRSALRGAMRTNLEANGPQDHRQWSSVTLPYYVRRYPGALLNARSWTSFCRKLVVHTNAVSSNYEQHTAAPFRWDFFIGLDIFSPGMLGGIRARFNKVGVH